MSLTTKQLNSIHELMQKASAEDLTSIYNMYRFEGKNRDAKLANTFNVGDLVKFDAGNRGGMMSGKVVKVNRVKVKIDCGKLGTWNVPSSLLIA